MAAVRTGASRAGRGATCCARIAPSAPLAPGGRSKLRPSRVEGPHLGGDHGEAALLPLHWDNGHLARCDYLNIITVPFGRTSR